MGVHGGHADVEAIEEVGWPVHRPVRSDVEFGPVQQVHWRRAVGSEAGVKLAHLLPLGQHFLAGHPLHEQVRRVIGDGVVRVTAGTGCRHHVRQRGHAVGEAGVGMQVAADIGVGDHDRELAAEGGLHLAGVFAQCRRHPGQAEPVIDLLLGPGDDQLTADRVEQAVLRQLEFLADGDLADPHVVRLRSGEVLQGGSPGIQRDHPQVHLQPAISADRRLGVTAPDDLGDPWQPGERGHQRSRVPRGREHVHVADGFPKAAQRACVRAPQAPGGCADGSDNARGQVVGDVQQHALAGAFHQLDATQQLLFALGPESLEARQLARVDGLGELGNRADLEFGVKLQRAFRPERRDPCQVPDPGGDLRASFFKRADGAGRGELADLLGD